MIIFKREPAVERMIDFVSKFAPTLCKKTVEKGNLIMVFDHLIIKKHFFVNTL
jgi:hypothetical protein